jgi:anion-transporting  ArsA/GET3 family ATPase
MSVLAQLATRQFLVVTGKGGVGKTVVTALLGRVLASEGRRVLLLEIDPRANLHELAGTPPSDGEVITVGPNLFLQNLRPAQVMAEVVRDQVKIEMLARRVTASPIFTHFVDAAPGLKQVAILGHAWRALHGHGPAAKLHVDTVVLDAPATGHGVTLLTAPLVVSGVVEQGPFGQMAGELAGFIGDATRSAIVTVTLAEEMPVQEALELRAALEEKIRRAPDLLVVNGLYPPVPASRRQAVDAGEDLWQRRRAINDRELARLARHWKGPRVELPLLPVNRGPELVSSLLAQFAAALVEGEVPA